MGRSGRHAAAVVVPPDPASTPVPAPAEAERTPLLERLVAARPPRGAAALLLVLVVACVVVHHSADWSAAGLVPALLAVVLAALWSGWSRAVPVLLVAGLAPLPLPPAVPPDADLVVAGLTMASLAAVAAVVRGCVAATSRARAAVLQARTVHEQESRTAQSSVAELTSQLQYWATHDALTRMLNRSAFERLLDAHVAAGLPTGVLVVSLAGFTAVNDELGHEAGNAVLVQLGQRLAVAGRGTDVAARLGGDTFAVLLAGLHPVDAPLVGTRVVETLQAPMDGGGTVVALRTRAGVAVRADLGSGTGIELLRCAEAAARTATPGREPAVWTGAAPRSDDVRQEADLARGLAAGELFVLYQPLVSTATGRVASVEALVRWRHPERGLVPPDAFIGLAERTGLIVPLGLHVLRLACAQLRAWSATAPELSVAVNVSVRQLLEPGFVEEVRALLWGSGVNCAQVVLELTESMLVEDGEAAVAVLWQLRALGVRLALDDFGTGYSSLARLGELPLDEIKIDKSFVDRLGAQPHDSTTLLTAAVAMGQGLGLTVVAEGVETAEQAAFLRDVRCDLLQGYLFSRPQSPEDLAPLLGKVLLAVPDVLPGPRAVRPVEQQAMVVPSVMPPVPGPRG